MSKYNNKITVIDGTKFHSKKEATRFLELKLLERGGVIKDLKRQVVFILVPKGENKKIDYELKYVADFTYIENEKSVVEDVKGYRTEVYRIKKRLMKAVYGIEILET